MIKIAIADDDKILVKIFRDYFLEEPHIKCVFFAYTVKELFENLSESNKIEYLFLDIDFNGESSISYIPKLKKEYPNVEIIMFTQNTDDKYLFKALFAGASGFLPKSVELDELKEYIKIILQGGAAITPQLAKKLILHFQPKKRQIPQKEGKDKKLSEKDVQILELIAGGYGYQAIADKVGLTINGVRYHIKKIYNILHVNNRAGAVTVFKSGLFGKL